MFRPSIRLLPLALIVISMPIAANAWAADVWSEEACASLGSCRLGCDDTGDCGCHDRCTARDLRADWSIQAGGLLLHRTENDSVLLMENVANPARRLSAGDYDFGVDAGWSIGVVRQGCGKFSFGARYLNFETDDARLTAIDSGGALLAINNSPPFFLAGVRSVTSRYDSDLDSVEVGGRYQIRDCFTALAGFRFVALDERFGARMDAGAQTPLYGVRTKNRLYGGQLGLIANLYCDEKWQLESTVKAGIFGNEARQQTLLDTGTTTVSAADQSDPTSLVSEIHASLSRRFTERLTFHAGYQLLWIETVALAADQIPATDFNTGRGIDARDGIFFHGAMFGLECQL